MCGIAGFFDPRARGLIEESTLRTMAAVLRHRGPDQAGIYLDDHAALVHDRLSIIDIGGGAQPLSNEDGTIWITYNGEVFNYLELRHMLVGRGHRFATTSDTEVLVHLYEDEGPEMLNRLNGQFAFALWDSRIRRILLARDRLGIRPVHYTVWQGVLLFASEIKALFAVPGVERRLDPVALRQISTLWTTLPGRTAFENVHELAPGHLLIADERITTTRSYWRIPFGAPGEHLDEHPRELADRVRDALTDAVRIRLRADVPVGAYVSGGLDSSIVSGLAAKRFTPGMRTFGIRFADARFDEGGEQRRMAAWLGTPHHETPVSGAAIAEAFADAVWHIEKPLTRTSPVPLFLLSKDVRESGLKVVLTGEGADEAFGGYGIFKETLVRRFWARRPDSPVRRRLIEQLYPHIFSSDRMKRMLPAFFEGHQGHLDDPLFSHMPRWHTTSRIAGLLGPELRRNLGDYDVLGEVRGGLPEAFAAWDHLTKAQYLEMSIFLSTYLLSSQGDRVAMGHSVEIRVPFLDHRVIELACAIPPLWRILGLREKHILRRAFQDLLPEQIAHRPKFPYRAPIAGALLGSDTGEMLRDVLSGSKIAEAGVFDPARTGHLVRLLRERGDGGEVDSMGLAFVASTMLLHEQFVGSHARRFPPPLDALDVWVDRRIARHTSGDRPSAVHTDRGKE